MTSVVSPLFVLVLLCCILVHEVRSSLVDCPDNHVFATSGGYDVDLSGLKGLWQTVFIEGTDIHSDIATPRFYNISLFDTFETRQCNGHHICYTETFDSFHVLGKHGSCRYRSEDKTVSIVYDYDADVYGSGNVTINFVCGSTLGVPEVLEGDPRNHAVEMIWITSKACKLDREKTAPPETRCYNLKHTIDSESGIEAEFVDLSGLIRHTGGYEATMAERPDLIMNVSMCRPMESTDACSGSNVCLFRGDSHLNMKDGHNWPLPLGYISEESLSESIPHYESGVLTAIFPIKKDSVKCSEGSAFAKVRFFCPTGDEALGPSIEYIDNNLCVVIIVWYTMHACDIKTVQSTKLTLTTSQGTSFDLRGLPEVVVPDRQDTKTYFYTIHPSTTGNLNSGCQEDNNNPIHVTQTENGTAVCRSLGEGTGKLRYIDSVLTLTYTNGDTCHDGFARTSIITFVCPNDVVGGAVRCDSNNASKCVSFNLETHCLYEFEWITDLACGTEATPSSSCRFKLNDIDYNLGLLTEDYSSTYAAISSSDPDTECFLINPCGNVEVTALTNLSSSQHCNQKVAPRESCDQSSVCRIPKSGSTKGVSLGTFHLEQSSLLHSVVKDVISVATKPISSNVQAVIHYICQTGTLLTSPVFISHDSDVFEFHWYTFAACPQGVSVGSECLVTQPSTGFTFNLSALSNTIFNFTDKIHHHNYSVSVCSKFPKNMFGESCSSNSAVCQHVSGNHHNSAGQMNTTLIYADSALKLHYMNGKNCSSNDIRHTTVVFLCNPDVHTATIQNVTEIEHCSYVVEMETKLACPPAYRSAECVYFSSDGKSYDLTPLEKTTGNWEATGSDGSVYLINVCRPLNLQGVGQCNPLSAVCKVSTSVHNVDLGIASTASFGPPPKSADSHVTLVLNYSHPSSSDDGCSNIYTSIQFVCNRTAPIDSGPRHLSGGGTANPCEYIFLWQTRLVCPIEEQSVKKACNITDEATGYVFDLTPLKQHHGNLYTVIGSDSNNYTLTLCDELKKSTCAGEGVSVCQSLRDNHHFSSGVYSSMELTYIDGSLSLYYKDGDKCSNNDIRTTQIDFLCDRLAGDDYFGQPKFVSESSHCHYLFEWATPLACPPAELSCLAAGGKYNLKPLMEKRNWFISGNGGQQYVIGGCQAIDSNSIPECAPSVSVGACLYTPSSGSKGDVLGYLTGDIVEVSEGHLKLSYHNGKMCPDEGLRSIVNIHFHCKPEGGAGNPILESSAGCVTEITWDTQYACAQDNATKGWVITNPSTGQTYDLSKLTSPLSSIHKGYKYTVGLAGDTVPCGSEKNVMICQTSVGSGHTYVIARKDGDVTLELVGGKVQFTTQNGDQCHHHNQISRKATVYFEYDPRDDYLMVLPEQGCEYSFVVFTKLVREEKQEIGIQCYVESFPDLEWFTTYPTPPILVESDQASVYFSVCSPISSSNQQAENGYDTCHHLGFSGACYARGSEVLDLGRPTSHYPPAVSPDGNAVQLTYVNGDSCDGTKKTFTTKILLVCSNNTGSVPEVTYLNKTSCEAIIIWRNPHACPLQIPTTPISDSVCSILDPADGTVLNLQPLVADNGGVQVSTADGNYILGICGPVNKDADSCSSAHAGVCHHKDGQWMKMVDANHSLTLVSHSPHAIDIQYSSGEKCDTHQTYTINLHIYCSNKKNSQQPSYESRSDCELRFTWPTSALCLTEVEGCYVSYPDKTILDLEPLVSKHWEGAFSGNSEKLGVFNVSVCRNLNPTINEGSYCFPGPAGICFQEDVSKNKYKNLGYMSSPPALLNGEIVLQYTKGDSCGDSGKNISTTIYLKCPDIEYDTPPQMRTTSTDCHYEIDWSTQVACKHNKEESGSCVLDDSQSGVQYNFKPLAKQFTFEDDSSSSSYSICLCPNHGSCSTGIVNTTGDSKVNLGTFDKLVVYPNTGPQVNFIGGDKCTDSNQYSSKVMMFCDRGIKEEKGKFFYEKDLSSGSCLKYFSWWTPVACTSPQVSCIIQDPFYDFNPIYPPNGSWVAVDSKNREEYLINICGPVHVDGNIGCSGNTAVCHKRKDGTYHDLAYTSTQRLTINGNKNPEVQFSSTEKCSNGGYSSVIIEMICGLEGLKFRKKDGCVYRFDWHTTYACQESERLHTQTNCDKYVDSNEGYTFYPDKLSSDSGYHVTSGAHGAYHINLCGDESSDCREGVAVCHTHTGGSKLELGTSDSLTITIDSYWMRFSMTGQDGSSVITVECADSDQENSPNELETLTLENEFTTADKKKTAYFRMYTKKGCEFKPSTTASPSSSSPGSNSRSSTTQSSNKVMAAIFIILAVVVLIVIMILTIVLWNRDRRERVFKRLSSLFAVKANEPVKYVRARTTEASLLEESSSEEEPLTVATTEMGGTSSATVNDESTNDKEKKKKKKDYMKDSNPLIAEYRDEEHLSDEELLNL